MSYIKATLLNIIQQSGQGLEIQMGIRASFNNGKFFTKEIKVNESKSILMISKNIPDLRNKGEQKGVLFVLTKSMENLPKDLESVLSVFTSIISQWLELYTHEVIQRQIHFWGAKDDDTEYEEVKELE